MHVPVTCYYWSRRKAPDLGYIPSPLAFRAASHLQLLGPLRALRAVNLYRPFGLAPSCRYTKQHSQARAVFRCARKAAGRSIYIGSAKPGYIFVLPRARSARGRVKYILPVLQIRYIKSNEGSVYMVYIHKQVLFWQVTVMTSRIHVCNTLPRGYHVTPWRNYDVNTENNCDC